MPKTLVIAGYGPGISHAVAEKFGKAGFSLALVARTADKLTAAAKKLEGQGIRATAFPVDLTQLSSVRQGFQKIKSALGPVTVLHWNVATPSAGDLVSSPAEELLPALTAASVGLVAAVQELLPDMRQKPESAVLVTNGGFGLFDDRADAMAVQFKSMGMGVANAAKHKTSRLLAVRLQSEGVYVGEVMVSATVKGTAWDRDGKATLEASTIADRFWSLYEGRRERFVQIA